MGRTKAAAGIVAALVFFSAGWTANGWRLSSELANQRAEHIDQLRLTAEANAQVILQQQTEQQKLARTAADLDAKHYEEMSNALSENQRLEALYSDADDERRRLRIDVIIARNDAIVSETTGAGRVGDAASLELSGEAGRAVWRLRESLIEDSAKLKYLQEFARQLR